ncbi:protein-tyrosine phosphatase family protein [Fuerstiella marisgermanici]|uniref:Dual specificity phosphatase, catalytic domain n=1 Tax=Fuerstiella marisgermanici TaxID=1891926 RepID=A0A1P8WCY2_9PLAN|nr:dual specificity protein phosphatase [Fuerstiella marisgermanici]APZ91907.1 Dual specificity phosphatase, catalytic domain [Fuerstiella marisgermanici]
MIRIPNTTIWLGNSADLRDSRRMLGEGIDAIIDLAIEEPFPPLPRLINYCRFVVSDDGENDPAILQAAIAATAMFVQGGHRTGICCNAGLSRSLCVAAAVMSYVSAMSPNEALEAVSRIKPTDVNPALWRQIVTLPPLKR